MKSRQAARGVTLIVVLIFLVLITLLSISVFKASTTNLRVTQNMAVRQEATGAAQAAIETVISTPAFQAASAPTASVIAVDVDGDNTNDYTVTVMPAATCSRIRTLQNVDLPHDPATGLLTQAWIRCDSGSAGRAVGSGSGSAGLIESDTPAVVTGTSYCVETHWNLQATVNDLRSGAVVEVNQGVTVPYSVGESQDRCQRNN
jgi:Tfp pilus assembly protein PilX